MDTTQTQPETGEPTRLLRILGWIDWLFVIWGLFIGTVVSRAVLAPMHRQSEALFLAATPFFARYYAIFTAASVASICLLAAGARLMMRGARRGVVLHRMALTIALIAPLALLALRAHTGFTPGGRGDGEGYALLPLTPQLITLWPLIGLFLAARLTPRPRPAAVITTTLVIVGLTAATAALTHRSRTHAYPLTLERTDIMRAFTGSEDSAWRTQLSLLPNSFYGAEPMAELTRFAAYCRAALDTDDRDQAAAATVHLAALISRVALELEAGPDAPPMPPLRKEPDASLYAAGAYLSVDPFSALFRQGPPAKSNATRPAFSTAVPPEHYVIAERPAFLTSFEKAIDWPSTPEALHRAVSRDRSLMPLQRDIGRAVEAYEQATRAHADMRECVARMAQLEAFKREIVSPPPTQLPFYLPPAAKTDLQTRQLGLPNGGHCPNDGNIEPGPYGRLPSCSHHGSLAAPHP